eukprot:1392901-Rhodomonas_salina.1
MAAGTKASQKPRIFTCGMCQITIPYVYYGRQPKSAPQVVSVPFPPPQQFTSARLCRKGAEWVRACSFLEEAFIAQDPFATEP